MGHAKAAVLTIAQEVLSKLIADHKRETEAVRKQSDEQIRKTTEGLARQFEGVAKFVASLQGHDTETRQWLETVWRSLFSPTGRVNWVLRVTSVMYLPNEGAIEKFGRANSTFVRKARKQGIILAGPGWLAS